MVEEIKFETIPAYNTNKQFHPKENESIWNIGISKWKKVELNKYMIAIKD